MPLRWVFTVAAVIVVSAAISIGPAPSGESAQGAVSSTAAAVPACDLRLPPPMRGEPHFAIPRGGRATLRALAGGFRLCRLLRADGSRFAQAEVDRLRRVVEVHFFRRTGRLLFARDAAFAATPTGDEGADVGCSNDSFNAIGPREWDQHKWWIGKTPSGIAADKVVAGAPLGLLRVGEQHQLVRLARQRGSALGLPGPHGLQDEVRRKERRGVGELEGGPGLRAGDCVRCFVVRRTGQSRSSRTFVSARARSWSVKPDAKSLDIQSVAAHEFGHVRQFDHVTGGDNAVVMWPYVSPGDTSGRKLGRGDSRGNNTNY